MYMMEREMYVCIYIYIYTCIYIYIYVAPRIQLHGLITRLSRP